MATFRPHPGVPNHTFLRTKFAITRAGDVVLDFGSAPKGSISLWADGKPVPIEGKTVKLPMSQGDHWVFVGVTRDIIGEESLPPVAYAHRQGSFALRAEDRCWVRWCYRFQDCGRTTS